MVRKDELSLFVVRAPSRRFRLVTEEGTLILEGESWRELKRDLEDLLLREPSRVKVSICVGHPCPVICPPAPASRPRLAPVQIPAL